jgi:ribonuclease HIII
MQTRVGTDEAFKGDTFGGLVVAGVRADDEQRQALVALGVQDSKKLKAGQVALLAAGIMKSFPFYYIELSAADYNDRIAEYGLTRLLNMLHAKCYSELKAKGSKHIVDRFPGCSVGDIAIERAESEHPEVAAASIIARQVGLEQMQRLSLAAGFCIPLGSTHVLEALEMLKQRGLSGREFVKLHFKNVKNAKIYK